MGTDKALIGVAGRPLAVRAAAALETAGAAEVFCVGGDAAALRAAGLVVVPDDRPGAGPLAAIVTALGSAAHPVVAVVACDLVAPDPTALAAVVAALDAHPVADAAVPLDAAGTPQPLHAAYRVSVRPALERALAAGERSIRRALVAAQIAVLDVHELDPAALRDADVPADLPLRADR